MWGCAASAAGHTFNTGGKVNGFHSVDFDIVDDELAYVVTAKIFALSAYRLLPGRGCESKRNCGELSAHLYQRGVYQIYGFLYQETETYS